MNEQKSKEQSNVIFATSSVEMTTNHMKYLQQLLQAEDANAAEADKARERKLAIMGFE